MRTTLIAMLAVGSLVLAAPATQAATNPAGSQVTRETLANGLRVVIVRDPLAPVVATAVN
jgi:zinc protease